MLAHELNCGGCLCNTCIPGRLGGFRLDLVRAHPGDHPTGRQVHSLAIEGRLSAGSEASTWEEHDRRNRLRIPRLIDAVVGLEIPRVEDVHALPRGVLDDRPVRGVVVVAFSILLSVVRLRSADLTNHAVSVIDCGYSVVRCSRGSWALRVRTTCSPRPLSCCCDGDAATAEAGASAVQIVCSRHRRIPAIAVRLTRASRRLSSCPSLPQTHDHWHCWPVYAIRGGVTHRHMHERRDGIANEVTMQYYSNSTASRLQ